LDGCAWSASANCNWVTITNPSGTGSSAINYTVTANSTIASRTCNITINGQVHTITQSAAACTYALNANAQSFNATGGNSSFNLTTLDGCAWSASANCNWVTISNPSGTGSNTINYTVGVNSTTASRTCNITVNGQVHTVTQSAASCTYALSANIQNLTAVGGNGAFNLTTMDGCTWSASADCNWVTVTNASGTGSGTINYTVAVNPTILSRTCKIAVNGQNYTITQSGTACTYSISSNTQSFAAAGGNGTFNLTTLSGCAWSAAADCNWVTLANTSGSNTSTLSYIVLVNTSTASRTCTITVNGQSYLINQAGAGVATNDIESLKNLAVFPNPNHGLLVVEFELLAIKNIDLKIYNAIGQAVYSHKSAHFTGKFKQQINLTQSSAGIYFLVLDIDHQKVVKRIIIN
jgi:hypothetical protein